MKSQLGARERATFPLHVRSLVQLLCSSTEQQRHWQATGLLRTGEQASSSQPNAVGVQVGERAMVCSVLNVSSDLASLHRLSSFVLAFTFCDVKNGSRLASERWQLKPRNGNKIPLPEILIGFISFYLIF